MDNHEWAIQGLSQHRAQDTEGRQSKQKTEKKSHLQNVISLTIQIASVTVTSLHSVIVLYTGNIQIQNNNS